MALLLLLYGHREFAATGQGGAVAGAWAGQETVRGTGGLDLVEITDPSGWHLRLESNGSARLTHAQYPGHSLGYPPRSFLPHFASRARAQCAASPSRITPCTELRYYDGRRDRTEVACSCLANPWASEQMEWALQHMALADDADPAGRRARRLLEREWLATSSLLPRIMLFIFRNREIRIPPAAPLDPRIVPQPVGLLRPPAARRVLG